MELTHAIARLLCEPALRATFRAAPRRLAAQLCTGTVADQVARLDPAELERQANVLIEKRFAAVRSLVPISSADRRRLFDDFSARFWPRGHRRHQADALAFLRFLQRARLRVCAREYNRMALRERGGRFRLAAGWIRTRAGWRVGLHLAMSGRPREWLMYLG